MKRNTHPARHGWERKCEEQGFLFHSVSGGYWRETASYEFQEQEVETLRQATSELHEMCIEVVRHVLKMELLDRYQIPPDMYDLIYASWEGGEKTLYGRFDLAYDGVRPPKLLEYNADTPTALLEGADIQRRWMNDVFPGRNQFNLLREALARTWPTVVPEGELIHMSSLRGTTEDACTVEFLRSTAAQAKFKSKFLFVDEIGFNDESSYYTYAAKEREDIRYLFKLYPWEWMVIEPHHKFLHHTKTRFIEPMWKMLLSNKALLAMLWNMFPNHPNLLPTSFYPNVIEGEGVVRKPLLSREGANIQVHRKEEVLQTGGLYGAEGYIYQELFELPNFDGWRPVIGSWVIGDTAAGIGIREDQSLITKNTSFFVPHYY